MSGYLVKITIEKAASPTWRKVVLPDGITFADLHEIIQICFGWEYEHAHDFCFPNGEFCVGRGKSDWMEILPESKIVVDDFLKQCKWIQYTYDFGDNWEHKIVLEKELPEYEARMAQLQKWKGDNFEEDTGGVWDDVRMPFSEEETKERLEVLSFPRKKQSRKAIEKLEELEMAEKWKKLEKALRKKARETKKQASGITAAGKSGVAKQMEAWHSFLKEKSDWEKKRAKNGQKVREVSYEQMTLPFVEMPQETVEKAPEENYTVWKMSASETMEELLNALDMQEARDYCRYLRIPYAEGTTKKKLAHSLAQTFSVHPEYFLSVLDENEFQELQQLFQKPDGRLEQALQEEMVVKSIALGLMKLEVSGGNGARRAELKIAADAEAVFTCLSMMNWKKEMKKVETVMENSALLLQAYGVADGDMLYETYSRLWKMDLERDDYLRILYWHGTFAKRIQSATSTKDGKSYFAFWEVNLENALARQQAYASEVAYKELARWEVEQWKEGFGAVYECWESMEMYLFSIGMREGEIAQLITELFLKVENGASCVEIWEALNEKREPETLGAKVSLWNTVQEVVLNSSIAGLKGYTRHELAEAAHAETVMEEALETTGAPEEFSPKTPMIWLPADDSLTLYKVMHQHVENVSPKAKKILAKYPENEELRCLLAVAYLLEEQYGKAEKVLKGLESLGDPSVREMLRELRSVEEEEDEFPFDDEFWDVPRQAPVRRETPKVGRNDPCPCGSGKKYKRCCGK
ncbi:MAG: SEC-C metal-binding domain-containing protein [Eubacteriales bacterium]|nr:SEC-C metal-binding domain-containing protein [Eubacteriales bacterium]